MNHKWKNFYKTGNLNIDGRLKEIVGNKICVRCGLLKGYIRYTWNKQIYFKNKQVLSISRLPYACYNDEVYDVIDKMKIKKEDFMV